MYGRFVTIFNGFVRFFVTVFMKVTPAMFMPCVKKPHLIPDWEASIVEERDDQREIDLAARRQQSALVVSLP
jgi:hypothetical protein